MLVYGDRAEVVAPRKGLRALTATLKQAEETPAGPARHDGVDQNALRPLGTVTTPTLSDLFVALMSRDTGVN